MYSVSRTLPALVRRLSFELRYALGSARWDSGISPNELLDHLERNPPGRAVDLGCGTGTNAISIARHGWQVLGIDFSSLALRQARRKARREGLQIEFRLANVSRLELDGAFELALDIGCFHALTERDRAGYVAMLTRALVPGGTYLLYTFLDAWVAEQELRSLFGDAFQIENVDYGEDVVGGRPSAWFTMRANIQ